MPVEQAHVHVILNSNQAFHFSIISDPGGGAVALIQKGRGCSSYLFGVKNKVVVQGPQQELLRYLLGH